MDTGTALDLDCDVRQAWQRLALVSCMRFPEEDVCMTKVFNGVRMHGA